MMPQLVGAMWWWIGTAIGGGLVLLLTSWAVRRTTAASAKQRLGEWGVAAALLLAALRLGPSWLPVITTFEAAAVQPTAVPPAELAFVMMPTDDAVGTDITPEATFEVAPAMVAATSWSMPISFVDALMLAYLALAALFFARWLLGQWGLARLLRKASRAPDDVQRVFDSLAAGLPKRVRLAVSDRVAVPMCCGLWRPTVVLPRLLAETAGPVTLRWVFAHELTHLQRRDPWSCWLLGLAQAVYFYVPWFWWLRRQVRLCQEFVADRAAVAQGQWADDYAQFLVSLASSPRVPLGATGVLGTHSDLYRRVSMVLNPSDARGRDWSRGRILFGAASLVSVAVLCSGLGVRAEAPKSDKVETPEAEVVVVVRTDSDDVSEDIANLEKKLEQAKDKLGPKHPEVKKIEEKLAALRDAQKAMKDSNGELKEKKGQKRVWVQEMRAGDVLKMADAHKKIKEALEKAKLSDEQVQDVMKEYEKISKELAKVHHDQAKVFHGALAGEPGAGVFGGPEGPMAMRIRTIGRMGGGRLGIETDAVGPVLEEQLGLPHGQGLIIRRVMPDSAAEKAGLKANDIMLSFSGKPVPSDVHAFIKQMEGVDSGKEIDALVLRKGKKESISGIKLAEAKKDTFMQDGGKFEIELGERVAAAAPALARLHDAERSAFKKPGKMVSVTINNGEFSASEQDGDVKVVVIGKVNGKKVEVTNVTITEPGVKLNLDSLDRVPEKYQSRIKRLIENAGDSPVKFESKSETR